MTTSFRPTAEQEECRRLFATGQSMAIEALAGTGKTATLALCGEDADERGWIGQYIVFNKAMAQEAASRFPKSVSCNTAHSLAFRAVGKNYARRLDSSERMKSWDIARILGLDPIATTTFLDEKKTLSPMFLAGAVMRGIDKFCQSADAKPSAKHIPYIEGLDDPNPHGPRRFYANNLVARELEHALNVAWNDLRMYEGKLRFTHACYLKIWELSGPKIAADYILADEAQDLNPVLLSIIQKQDHAQRVYVGDNFQQIYSFTGAVNALAQVDVEHRAYLTQSFRFGVAVADAGNGVLDALHSTLTLKGLESIPSVVCPVAEPSAILTRTNAAAVRAVFTALANDKRPFLVGGGTEIVSFARAAQKLMEGGRTEHPELSCFASWGEVIEYVAHDEQGDDLRLMVGLVDEFGVARILEALGQTVSESACDVVISTAHKSKGREWHSVQLAGDFPDEPREEELRLLYVAVTRAKVELDIIAVGYLNPDREAITAPGPRVAA